ncbi:MULTISPECIES: DUF6170 family protein [Pseudoalteromonas]|uniref:Uncharacterized protein n=1 Tax=Pseudoalteromonas carrageenovora IAM 12662 TaxID=1314868 RepID=A0A2K4XB70_PSEVC|nr:MULTISPECIES: DUF6170 family protein [Pseudoalteromonas]KTF12701.1 hypothetical protein ATS74_04450 [Pseudoalteromonas sp. H103]MBE0383791.1 hypothetical protein [Pseudoalteromonas carrageenovora IAM 12662]MCQ8888950.1 DUF6170 family protein [Pseudoalteromonas carrageenovora]MDO6464651.1 DUF6170 family protein [Pseudoalteromonas carrageenovora]MDO6547855.1 DUF6170 family protein [Pseudoalteromonas carrageenovora]|tara:strand:- start:293 stop:595 length:303 start_codon:yes stop_codon:yes gene_type:complete
MFTFFSSQIDELKQLKIRQRQQVIALSLSMLSPTDRVLLRIIKLVLLSPLFLIFTVFKGWILIPFLIIGGLCYPLLTTPIEINFAKKHLAEALKQYNQSS